MIEFDQNVYLSFKNITKMESHKQGITNFHATKENHEFIIKVVKINQKDRQNMQHFINQELLQSWRIKQNQKNKLSLKELIVMEKPHQYGYDYYIIRPYENRYTMRELLTKENKLLKQKQMVEIILKMLGLFVSTAHVNHVVMSADNIFLRNTCNGLQFAVNLTACTDYLFLEKGKQIKQHYFKEIAHYLHDHTFIKTHKFDFQLKIHCFSALLLQLILKMPLAFQNLPNNYNQLWARRQEMSEISLSYSKLLKLGNTQQQIKKIAQKLNISNCNLYQFLECILVVNQQNIIKAQNKFGNWAKIINLFLPNYFSKLIFRKQFPLQKIYKKQTEYSRKMYQKWKIIERIDQTQSVEQKDKGLKLYGLFKYGHLRQYRIDNGNRSQFNYFIVSDDVMMEVTEEEEHLGQTMLDFNSQGKYRKILKGRWQFMSRLLVKRR